MMRFPLFFVWVLAAPAWAQTPAATEFFEKKIRPILANRCQACHNAKIKTAGLDLSSAEGFLHGGQSGALRGEGDVEASPLLKRIGYGESMKIPPPGKPQGAEIAHMGALGE